VGGREESTFPFILPSHRIQRVGKGRKKGKKLKKRGDGKRRKREERGRKWSTIFLTFFLHSNVQEEGRAMEKG